MSRVEQGKGHLVPLAMLLFGSSTYAMTFSLNRIAITEGIPVFPYVFWQGVTAGAIALIAGLAVGQRPRLSGVYLRFYFIFGFIGIALPYTLLALAAPKVPAGAVALTLTLSPILTYAFSILFKIDVMRLLRVAGILLGLAGILVVLAPGASLPEPGMALWLLLAFGSPVCYAFGSVTVVFLRPQDSQPIPLTCGIAFAGAILMLPVMAAADSWWLFDGDHEPGRLVTDRQRRAHGVLLRARAGNHSYGRAGLLLDQRLHRPAVRDGLGGALFRRGAESLDRPRRRAALRRPLPGQPQLSAHDPGRARAVARRCCAS